jgi:DNA-binding GntR family transcriptional regulator
MATERVNDGDGAQPKLRGESVGRVVAELRQEILAGGLAPGTRIGQVELARRFGTSRLPVREALRQLHHEGLVALVPNVGARVATFKAAELEEIYRLREAIEPMLIAESVPHLSSETVAACHEDALEMEAVSVDGPAAAANWLDIDRRFHRRTFEGVEHMRHSLRLIEGYWNMVAHYRLMYARLPHAYEFTHLEHRLLLDALDRRDPTDAANVLALHIRRTRIGLGRELRAREATKKR